MSSFITRFETSNSISSGSNLSSLSTSGLKDGDLIYVSTFGRYFKYNSTSIASASTGEVIVPSSGVGRWLTTDVTDESWTTQTTWYIDYTSGNDENAGNTSLTALKTIKEWYRRTKGFLAQNTFMYLIGTSWSSSDAFIYTINNKNGSTSLPILFITGSTSVVRAGTLTTSAARNAASNLAPIISDTSLASWTPYVNKMIVITSGSATGAIAYIAKDLGSNQARVSMWYNPTTFATASTPAAGSSYAIVNVTDINFTPKIIGVPYIVAQNLNVNSGCSFENFRYVANGCTFNSGVTVDFKGGQFLGCGFSGSSAALRWILGESSKSIFYASLFTTRTGSVGSALATYNEVIMQGDTIGAGFADAGNAAGHIQFGGAVGIFDATNAIYGDKNATISIGSSLYGSGNTTGIQLLNGAKCIIAAAITPTISCTTQISLPGGANQIPALTAGTSVPSASACSTFSQWAASPFSRYVMSYKDGSALISD